MPVKRAKLDFSLAPFVDFHGLAAQKATHKPLAETDQN